MGGRGSGGGGGASGANGNRDDPTQDQFSPLGDVPNANEAAEALGLTGKDKEHFETGARATNAKLAKQSPEQALSAYRASVLAYERKHGRYAARAYANGGYWTLLRAIRTAMAVASVATQAPSAPVVAAANASLIAAYWAARVTR